MADSMKDIRLLSTEIGARPASTEEEYYAATLLEKRFRSHGLQTVIDEFSVPMYSNLIINLLILLVGISGPIGINGPLAIVAFIIAFASLVLFIMERLGKPVVSEISSSGRSQNVVGRHPAENTRTGSAVKPVVLVAHYDSSRSDVLHHPAIAPHLTIIRFVVNACMVLVPVLLGIALIPGVEGVGLTFVRVLTVIASFPLLIVSIAQIISGFLMPYTVGANNNASGVAALLEILSRIRPRTEEDLRDSVGVDAGDTEIADEQVSEYKPKTIRRGAAIARAVGVVGPHTLIEYIEPEIPRYQKEEEPEEPRTGQIEESSQDQNDQDDYMSTGVLEKMSETEETEAATSSRSNLQAIPRVSGQIDGTEQFERISTGEKPGVHEEDAGSASESDAEQTSMFEVIQDAGDELKEQELVDDVQLPKMFEDAEKGFAEERARRQQEAEEAAKQNEVRRSRFADLPVDYKRPSSDSVSSEETSHEEGTSTQPSASVDKTQIFSPDTQPESEITDVREVDPQWGTTEFKPRERLVMLDVPDPSVAAVDPFSVSSVEPVGALDPKDFSSQDFATGTFETIDSSRQAIAKDDEIELDVPEDSFFSRIGKKVSNLFSTDKDEQSSRSGSTRRSVRRQNQEDEESLGDWLGVDDDFDAKSAGRSIGSWDNFDDSKRDSSVKDSRRAEDYLSEDDLDADQDWRGGAALSDEENEIEARRSIMKLTVADLLEHEIWFVTTGASDYANKGMREFLDQYEQELHGATIINIESIGVGDLTILEAEGLGLPQYTDRRLFTLMKRAGRKVNVKLRPGKALDKNSDATVAISRKYRAATLTSQKDGVVVGSKWMSDTPSQIEEENIYDAADVVSELIRRL